MKTHLFGLVFSLLGCTSVALLSGGAPVQAQSPKDCEPLQEVSTGNTAVRKVIKVGDQNTDFSVPTSETFKAYVVTLTPENDANYPLTINLKYNDGSSSTAYKRNVPLQRGVADVRAFRTPTERQPYQLNVVVSGALNNAYQLSAMACRKPVTSQGAPKAQLRSEVRSSALLLAAQ
jgi:hypothetical protein